MGGELGGGLGVGVGSGTGWSGGGRVFVFSLALIELKGAVTRNSATSQCDNEFVKKD